MQRPFCNLSAKDYGMKDDPQSFKAAKELNAAICDVIETNYMKYEDKWLAVYQVMKKHKGLGAVNQKAFDAIEAVFFLNGIHIMKKAPATDNTKDARWIKQSAPNRQREIIKSEKEARERIMFNFALAVFFGLLAVGWGMGVYR